uniref:Protein C10 n=1 Tax=Petromyzon marinus TaxID=7757 RepID=S4R9R8_PETMA
FPPCPSRPPTAVLAEVLAAFALPENASRMEEARDGAANDMCRTLQLVLPLATQIQQDVVKTYGFTNDGEGVLKFTRLIRSYESQDPEIASMGCLAEGHVHSPAACGPASYEPYCKLTSTPPIGSYVHCAP